MSAMNRTRRLATTFRIMFFALFPPKKERGAPHAPLNAFPPQEPIPVSPEEASYYLADLSRGLRGGRVSLFFPHCLPITGFFLLLRLKRQGFSESRAWSVSDGIAIEARR